MAKPPEKMKTIVEHLDKQMRHAIALQKLHLQLSFNPEVEKLFNNTHEAPGYNLIQQSVLFELVLVLCRFFDEDKRTKSIPVFFKENDGFKGWLPKSPDNRRIAFSCAESQWKKLKNLNLLDDVKNLRDKFWAHSDLNVGNVRLPRYSSIDEMFIQTRMLVEKLTLAVLDSDANFEDAEEQFEISAEYFYRVITEGQKKVLKERRENNPEVLDSLSRDHNS